MLIADAQRDVRDAYLDGAPGMLVSGVLWLATAAVAASGNVRGAWILLFVGGMFIFPVGTVLVRMFGGRARLRPDNPLQALGMQAAFLVPLGWPLVIAAGMTNEGWYFAAASWLVGIHYLPFITLYGMRLYGILAAALLVASWACVQYLPTDVAAAAWATGGIEVAAGVVTLAVRRRRPSPQPA